jgi:uncharacterized protein
MDARQNFVSARYYAAMLRIGGGMAILLLASAAAAAGEPSAPPHPSTMEVVARATVGVKPDRAELELGVTTDKKTAMAATAENQHKMEQVLAALKKEIGAGDYLKTSELSVTPRLAETRRGQPSPAILGYTVTNRVQVRVADTKAVGRLLDRAFAAGANTVERVEFALKDPEAAQNAAIRAASTKARARAAAIADGLGLRVGQVISVREGDRPESFINGNFALRGDKRDAEAMPVEAGSVEVTATVTVIFSVTAR